MHYTNRELVALRDGLEAEIFRLKTLRRLPGRAADATRISEQIADLNRERLALCAAIVQRRFEASRDVVSFARWVTGNGAVDDFHQMRPARTREIMPQLLFRSGALNNLKGRLSRLLAADPLA
jgi:hypothetical protein